MVTVMATVGEVKNAYSAFSRGLMGWPTCTRCNKPVDKMEMRQLPTKCAVAVTVYCHGATKTLEISGDCFDSSVVRFDGLAFVEKPLLDSTPI